MAEASKDPSPIAQPEPHPRSPIPLSANESRSSHSTPQLSAESQLSELPTANTTVTMRNIDSPAQQLPEEATHLLSVPPQQHPPAPTSIISTHANTTMQSNPDEKRDITMSGGGVSNDNQQQPQPSAPAASSASTAPSANTPNLINSNNASTASIPQVRPGGAPARVYMNEKIVPYLLEGMKTLAKEQ
ncbi:hypothetical protein EMCG_02215 [[Emmonsia] crescens]|uniref:COMPASS component SDC1 n=1 Tax=[Emmonsia] crescens TaxID=73230 RepID=A0A0G2J1S6_9EURO|nr:hypothetical protein EMCG_02215 [Emmonsia crescens UAMH 3008]